MAVELAEGVLIAGRYRLERFLGAGGMGTVWAAKHQVTGRRHALKFLRQSVPAPELRKRFLREARAACTVDHPNVVSISDVFDIEDGTPVMVMDLLEGESLRERLNRERKLSLTEVSDILLPVVSAVAAAHARGIIHRDLKPDNIYLLSNAGASAVRVLDFGVAKLAAAHDESGTLTQTGTLLGTPCYMSPEQGFGEKDVDHRSDIWSIGIILYEALSGVRPVEGDSIGQVLKRLMQDGITPIDAMVELPDDVYRLIDRLLQRDRNERPSDLREVFDTLRKYASAPASSSFEVHSARSATESWASNDKPHRHRNWVMAAAIVAVVIAVGLAVRRNRPSSGDVEAPEPRGATAQAATPAKVLPSARLAVTEPSPAPTPEQISEHAEPTSTPLLRKTAPVRRAPATDSAAGVSQPADSAPTTAPVTTPSAVAQPAEPSLEPRPTADRPRGLVQKPPF